MTGNEKEKAGPPSSECSFDDEALIGLQQL